MNKLKMTIMHHAVAMSLALSATGCDCTPEWTCRPGSSSAGWHTVVFDWHGDTLQQPGAMNVVFYPVGGGEFWRYRLPGRWGGRVVIPDGGYGAVAWGSDSVAVISVGCSDSYATAFAVIDTAMVQHNTSGSVWVAADPCVEINRTACIRPGSDAVVMIPEALASVYTVELRGLGGREGISRLEASLGGMAQTVTLADRKPGDNPVVLRFAMDMSSGGYASGRLLTLGRAGVAGICNMLSITATMTDGRTVSHPFDVTRQIADAPDPLDVHILVDSLSFDNGSTGPDGGALDVEVDSWQVVGIDINQPSRS